MRAGSAVELVHGGGGGRLRGAACRRAAAGRAAARRRTGTGRAEDPNPGTTVRRSAAEGARPSRRARGGEDPVHVRDPAALGASVEEPRCAPARLYLRGISTGDFQEALAGLLGKDAPNLSPSVIGRLTAAGRANTTLGVAVTCRPAATSTSGPTGSTSRPAWSQSRNACWW